MAEGFVIRKNQYYDSVFLMGVGKRLSGSPGVIQTAVLMGSDKNKEILAGIGVHDPQIDASQPNDLIVAVVAVTPEVVHSALGRIDEALNAVVESAPQSSLHALEEGLAQRPDANLVVISIPGEYAAREARDALNAGLSVFIFSDNVAIEDELALKELAAQKGLLVMGPDCGTSLIGGVGIGFANAVRRGSIGVIGAAGTGLQEFTSQVHHAGFGISHAIGTGSHDLSDEIQGLTTFAALDALEADAGTQVIAVVSKPPGAKTLMRLFDRLRSCTKPVVACLLGVHIQDVQRHSGVAIADTIDDAVGLAVSSAGGEKPSLIPQLGRDELDLVASERTRWAPEQRYLRGLFAGGTFCYQSQQILGAAGIRINSNAPLDPQNKLQDSARSLEHTVLDMGADEYTVGRPHPMIDGTQRMHRILAESRDPQVSILLLDFILGYGAAMDPVGELQEAIADAKSNCQKRGGHLTVVASITGTDGDPQDLDLQARLLRESGVVVLQSNAAAAIFCRELLRSA